MEGRDVACVCMGVCGCGSVSVWVELNSYQVKGMIGEIGNMLFSTYSQTLNG